MALMHADPFREVDRLAREVFGSVGTPARPSMMPMDAWRDGDTFRVEIDLPGVAADSIDLNVENNVVTVRAERPAHDHGNDTLTVERPHGTFSRELVLGNNLNTDAIEASYEAGVLVLTIPIADSAKPRKIEVTANDEAQRAIDA